MLIAVQMEHISTGISLQKVCLTGFAMVTSFLLLLPHMTVSYVFMTLLKIP